VVIAAKKTRNPDTVVLLIHQSSVLE